MNGKEVAHREDAEPHQPAYGGLGPPTLPRYRTPPRAVCVLAAQAGAERFTEVTWRQGSKDTMTSRFAVLTVRPARKQSLAAAQEAGGGRNRWDGVLPVRPSGGSTQKSAHRPDPLPGPRCSSGPAEVLHRYMLHLRTPPAQPSEHPQTAQNLTKHY
ncbi:transposase [Streptomyces sp. NPDC005706]|uniref:transposase n=1 Tax=Streptomyces sp. NPDC005706 TaxID=3157169 RepID=UPI0034001D74